VHVSQEDFSNRIKAEIANAHEDILTSFNKALVVRIYRRARLLFAASEYAQNRVHEDSSQKMFFLVTALSPLFIYAGCLAADAIGGIVGMGTAILAMGIFGQSVLGTRALRKIGRRVGDAQTDSG